MITHLWKEWRDHRAVLLGIAVLLPPVLFAAMLLIPEGTVALPTAGAAAGLAIAAFALGADLVPGEIRRGTLLFLRRLPAGLGPVFAAKAILLVFALAASTALGFGAGNLAQRIAGRPTAALDWTYAPEAIAVVLWIFAVAMWLPRGELAVPATALCLGAFVLPMHLMLAWNPGLHVPASAISLGCWVLIPAALLVAWASFRGRRFGGAWGSAWRGLIVTLILFTPAWGYVGKRVSDWRYFDLRDPACEVNWAFQGAGRYAFLNASCRGPSRAVILDLETGAWRTVGAPRDHFWPVRETAARSVFALEEEATQDSRGHWVHYYDALTGEEFKSGWSYMVHDEVERRIARPVPDDGARLEMRDEDENGGRVFSRWRRLVLVRDGQEQQVFPPLR